jgi:hypothetical protein
VRLERQVLRVPRVRKVLLDQQVHRERQALKGQPALLVQRVPRELQAPKALRVLKARPVQSSTRLSQVGCRLASCQRSA